MLEPEIRRRSVGAGAFCVILVVGATDCGFCDLLVSIFVELSKVFVVKGVCGGLCKFPGFLYWISLSYKRKYLVTGHLPGEFCSLCQCKVLLERHCEPLA